MRRATVPGSRLGVFGQLVASFGDLAVAVAYALAAGGAVVTGSLAGPARVLVAAPLVFVLPGYGMVAALYPSEAPTEARDGPVLATALRQPGATWIERIAFSLGASLAAVPLLAVGLSFAGVSYSPQTVVWSLAGVTTAGCLVGFVRRLRLPVSERAAFPLAGWVGELRDATVGAERRADAALNVALVVAVVVALASVSVGLAAPQRGETYTEVAVLTEQNGEYVAGGYPTDLALGERAAFTLSVANEGAATDYTAVVVLQRVRTGGESVTVLEQSELSRAPLSVPDGETVRRQLAVEPDLVGDDLRMLVLVFEGDPPASPSAESADQHLALWVDVSRASE
jgi:uncharacterized membrane protein